MLLLGQQQSFNLSQTHLTKVNEEVLKLQSFDCSLQDILRVENTFKVLDHYNLNYSHYAFGMYPDVQRQVDYYDIDCNEEVILSMLQRGCLFSQRTVNSRSQKSRFLSISPSLDCICFSRQGEEIEQVFMLSDVIVLLDIT